MSSPSALVSITRMFCFFGGVEFARNKKTRLKNYFLEENHIKLKQLEEVGLTHESLRGATFHMPKIHDPWFSEGEIKKRIRHPNYYLSPADEFAYQTKVQREKMEKLYQQKALIARSLAKERQPGYHSIEKEEVMDIDPKQPEHATTIMYKG